MSKTRKNIKQRKLTKEQISLFSIAGIGILLGIIFYLNDLDFFGFIDSEEFLTFGFAALIGAVYITKYQGNKKFYSISYEPNNKEIFFSLKTQIFKAPIEDILFIKEADYYYQQNEDLIVLEITFINKTYPKRKIYTFYNQKDENLARNMKQLELDHAPIRANYAKQLRGHLRK